MHDTIELEKRGIPATVVVTQAFRNVAVFQFTGKGMEGHPYVELPHPISNLTPEEMKGVALGVVDELVRQITA